MNFQEAIADYRFLKDREYPDKAALKLVSDRYRLSGLQRNCLFRAIFSAADCHRRQRKLIRPEAVAGRLLGLDWYNVLITVESYLKGFPVFLADDGLLRDSSGIHGSYRASKVTERAIDRILECIGRLGPRRSQLFLDSPISHSGDMAEGLRSRTAAIHDLEFEIQVSPSADYPLKSYEGVVATSDSSIIDRESVREVVDLPRFIIENSYGARVLPVAQIGQGPG